jgi:hypothetical protein
MSFTNIDSFFKDAEAKLELTVNTNLVTKSSSMLRELEEATPVDTGLAKASWTEEIHTQNDGKKVAILRNSVPYIQRLNMGSSKQAPKYFIERIALKYGKPLGSIVKVN